MAFEEHYFTACKRSKYSVISGPYFPAFGLNTEIYSVNLCIQSEYRKIRTRNSSVFCHFSHSDRFCYLSVKLTFKRTVKKKQLLDISNFACLCPCIFTGARD